MTEIEIASSSNLVPNPPSERTALSRINALRTSLGLPPPKSVQNIDSGLVANRFGLSS